jgi:hypothetical protein
MLMTRSPFANNYNMRLAAAIFKRGELNSGTRSGSKAA